MAGRVGGCPLELEDLPQDVLLQIVEELRSESLCRLNTYEQPLTEHAKTGLTPLKHLSEVSRSWRERVFPALFCHLQMPLIHPMSMATPGTLEAFAVGSLGDAGGSMYDAVLPSRPRAITMGSLASARDSSSLRGTRTSSVPVSARLPRRRKPENTLPEHPFLHAAPDDMIDFCRDNNITDKIQSILVFSKESFGFSGPASCSVRYWVEMFWRKLFRNLGFDRITVIAPPSTLAILSRTCVNLAHAEEFRIPFQRLDLERARQIPRPDGRFNLSSNSSTSDNPPDSLFSYAKWNSIKYNEGSSLRIYANPDHIEKRPPCIINNGQLNDFVPSLGSNITSISWTAVFPSFHHAKQVIDVLLNKLPALRRLEIQLIPSALRLVVDDTISINVGTIQLEDCWAEVRKGYRYITKSLSSQERHPGSRPRIVNFSSQDCHYLTMEAELERKFLKYAKNWERVGAGEWRWSRSLEESIRIGHVTPLDDGDSSGNEDDDDDDDDVDSDDDDNFDHNGLSNLLASLSMMSMPPTRVTYMDES